MFQWILKKVRKDNKGFTLIELVVVIAILGILAGIAVPKLSESRKNAATTAHNANVRTLEGAATMYIAENDLPTGETGDETVTWTSVGGTKSNDISLSPDTEKNDKWALYLQEWPKIPKGVDGLKNSKSKEFEGTDYTVTIDSKGNITVEPIAIPKEGESGTTIPDA